MGKAANPISLGGLPFRDKPHMRFLFFCLRTLTRGSKRGKAGGCHSKHVWQCEHLTVPLRNVGRVGASKLVVTNHVSGWLLMDKSAVALALVSVLLVTLVTCLDLFCCVAPLFSVGDKHTLLIF